MPILLESREQGMGRGQVSLGPRKGGGRAGEPCARAGVPSSHIRKGGISKGAPDPGEGEEGAPGEEKVSKRRRDSDTPGNFAEGLRVSEILN